MIVIQNRPTRAWLIREDAAPRRLTTAELDSILVHYEDEGWVASYKALYPILHCQMVQEIELGFESSGIRGILYMDEMGHYRPQPNFNAIASGFRAIAWNGGKVAHREDLTTGPVVFLPTDESNEEIERNVLEALWAAWAARENRSILEPEPKS